MKDQADFYVRRKLTFSYQARTNCYVQISLNIYTSLNLIVIFTTRYSLFPLRADLGHSITYLSCFDTVSRRPNRYYSIALKVIYPCPIATTFSPVIDYELKIVKMKF